METYQMVSEDLHPEYTIKDETITTKILKMLMVQLSWSAHGTDIEPLNLTEVSVMLGQLSHRELQVLYNATDTSSQNELIQVLNNTIMKPRKYEISLLEFEEFWVRKIMLLYIPPILILLGTFGNLFSFIVLRRKPMLKVSSYMYLAVLAVIDTLVLYNGLLRIWLVELMGVDYQESGNWICKLTVVIGYVSSDLSVWLIIAVTVERYIVVCFPFQASSMCNVSRARKVIVSLFLLMLALNVHFFWTAEIVEEQGWEMCRGGTKFRQLVEEIWPWVDTLIYSFLPFLTITVLNILIIREVAGARSNRIRLAGSEQESTTASTTTINATSCTTQRKNTSSDGTRLTALLLTVSFTFLLLTLPNNIALIVSRFWNQKYENKTDHLTTEEMRVIVHGMARFKLAMTITELLMYTNHSINFFLYCATGNKFRQQIFDLLRCLQAQRQPPAWSENTGISHSMRKTSHSIMSVGPHDMMLAKRAAQRKSSSFSSGSADDVEKNEDNMQFVDGKYHTCVNDSVESRFNTKTNLETTRSVDNLNICDVYSYQNGSRNSRSNNNQRSSPKSLQTREKCSPFSCKESGQTAKDKCCDMHLDSFGDRNCKTILSNVAPCKVYQSKKKQKHSSNSKRGSFGPVNDVNSKESEYILLQPTIRWCDSVTQS